MIERNPGSSKEFAAAHLHLHKAIGDKFAELVLQVPVLPEQLSPEKQKEIHDQPPATHDQREW